MPDLATPIGRLRRFHLELGGVLLLVALTGCVGIRPIDPAAGPIELRRDEGVLVIHIQTDVPLDSVWISGACVARNVPEGDHVLPLAMTAGSFRWNRVERKIEPYRLVYPFDRSEDVFGITVEAGKINYPGVLIIRKIPPSYVGGFTPTDKFYLRMRLVDHSLAMFEHLAKHYPALVEQLPFRYSGWGRDDFIDRYLTDRRRLSREASSEAPPP